jgi:hypothetical protein
MDQCPTASTLFLVQIVAARLFFLLLVSAKVYFLTVSLLVDPTTCD